MSELDPLTMMEDKSSNNIDLNKKVNLPQQPGPGDPPKVTSEVEYGEEGVELPETTFKSNALAAATWDRDASLNKLDKYLGLDKGDNFGVRKGLNPMYMDTRDIKNTRFQMGEAQSNWAKTGDALVRLGSDAVGTFIKEFSYLADVQNHISGGSDPSNWLADFITPLQESVSHNFEIFRDNDESVNIQDWGWWAEGTAQMGTTVGMLGAMLVTRGVGGVGARFASALQNVKKVEGTASFLNKLKQSYKMAGAAVPRGMASDFGYAVLSRAGESAMNADETYKSIKEELLSQGITEEIAEAKAKEAASEVYKGNWLMLGQDILQQRMFSGILGKNSFFGGSAKKVVENSGKGGIWAKAGKALTSGYGLGKDMIAEGMEEAYQYYVEEQARNKALVSTGLKSGPEYKAFSDFLNDGEMWNSAIWGAFGSAFMAGGMKAVNLLEKRKANIKQDPNIDEFTKAIELQKIDDEIYAKKAKMIHPVQIKDYYDEVANAASTNNPIAVNSILQRMATTSAINDVLAGVEEGGAFTKAEFANDPKAALESLMEDSIKIDEASAEMIKKRGQEYLDTYTKTAALFKANKEKYQDNYIAQAFTLTQMEHKIAKQELAELDATVDAGYSELSKDFKGTTNEVSTQIRQQLELQANQNFVTQAEKLIDIYKQSKQAEETVIGLEKAKKQAQKKVDEITKSLEEFNKDEAVSAEQKEALKTEGIDLLKNTELGQALISLMTARNFKSATEISAGEALRTASKEKFEKIKKEVEEIERKTKENLEKDTATSAEGETIKNPASTKENTTEEGEPLTDDEAVNDDDVNVEDGEESANYNSAKDEFAKTDHAEETKLKTINGVAWRSSNQNLTSKEDTATFENNELESLPGDDINREGVTKFLEDTSVDLNNYYIQYDVDVDRIDKSSIIGEKQFKAIQDGTEIPAIGLLPVKMTIFNKSDNSPVVYKGKQLTIWVHNANPVKDTMSHLEGLQESTKLDYAEKRNHFYHPEVMESAIVDTVNTKRKVVEASKSGQILTGTLHKVSNGHVIYSENESISDPKFGITPDLKFGIGNGVSIKSGKTSTSIGTKSPKSGVVYVQMPTGGWMPVKTRKVNQEEANLILDIYKEVLTVLSQGGNSKEVTPSKELLTKLKDSGILKYMPKEASLIDYLNTLVYQGSKTKGKRMLQAFVDNKTKRPLLSIGGTLFNIADLQEDSDQRSQAIDMLMENKLRNIEYSRLEDKAYKTAIIQFLTADVTTTPEGNLFVQPTIAHTMVNESASKPKYKAEKGFKSYTTNEGLYYINEANEVKNADGEVVTNPNIINKVKIANEQSKGTLQSTPGYVKLEDGTIIETTNFNTVASEEIINEVNLALSDTIDTDVEIEAKKADIEKDEKGNFVPKKYSLNLKGENPAPNIPLSAISEESFGGELPAGVKQVRLLEIRGKNSLGQTAGEVWVQKEDGDSYTADVFFNDAELAALEEQAAQSNIEAKKVDIENIKFSIDYVTEGEVIIGKGPSFNLPEAVKEAYKLQWLSWSTESPVSDTTVTPKITLLENGVYELIKATSIEEVKEIMKRQNLSKEEIDAYENHQKKYGINKEIDKLVALGPQESTEYTFDTKLASKIQSKLQELYPEIKLDITNNPVWEYNDDVLNQVIENEMPMEYWQSIYRDNPSKNRLELLNSLIPGIENKFKPDTENVYHGTAEFDVDNEGNLILKPSKNFNNKTTSISFTQIPVVAQDYMLRKNGKFIIKINNKFLPKNYSIESAEEIAINTSETIVIPSEGYQIIEVTNSKLLEKKVNKILFEFLYDSVSASKNTNIENLLVNNIQLASNAELVEFEGTWEARNYSKGFANEVIVSHFGGQPHLTSAILVNSALIALKIKKEYNYNLDKFKEDLSSKGGEEIYDLAYGDGFYSYESLFKFSESSFNTKEKIDSFISRLTSFGFKEDLSNVKDYVPQKIEEVYVIKENIEEDNDYDLPFQRNKFNKIIGQANIKAMTVLIDAVNQKQDTLPHEYAHHYIAWNRDTPIVQEAIKKWGSEEALVQAIGEQVVAQKGEAYNWWQKFVKWLLGDISKISKLDREKIKNILTDAFLTRQDLNLKNKTKEKETGLFKEDGSLNDDAYETVDAKSLFDLDASSEVIEDFPTSDTSTVLPDVNISTVEVTTAGESNIVEKDVPSEKPSRKRPLKKIKKRTNIVESGIGNTEKNSNIVTPTTSELDEEGKEINKNCNKKK